MQNYIKKICAQANYRDNSYARKKDGAVCTHLMQQFDPFKLSHLQSFTKYVRVVCD